MSKILSKLFSPWYYGLLTIVILGLAAGLSYRAANLYLGADAATSADQGYIQDWESLFFEDDFTGPEDAPIKIIEFLDYQCTYCREQFEILKEFRRDHPSQVAISYRHYPSGQHPKSFEAAVAAECSAQFERFDRYSQLLFEHPDLIETEQWSALAREAEIQAIDRFERCLSADRAASVVERDRRLAGIHDIRGTPTHVINGRKIMGLLSRNELERLITR